MPRYLIPATFVLLWSTGFLGARLGSPHAEPFHFLAWRFAVLTPLFAAASLLWRAPWPKTRAQFGWVALAGLLTHGAYLGGVFWTVRHGLPLGLVALIGSLQPVLTAITAAALLGERLRSIQWAGIALGFAGVGLVASGRIDQGTVDASGLIVSFLAVAGITCGTLVQKRWCGGTDFRTTGTIQYGATFLVMAIAAGFESGPVEWTPAFAFALGWLVIVNSICSIALLYLMLARGSISRVTSLFYLTPSVTAVLAWLLFDQPVTGAMMAGIAISSIGVFLVMQAPSQLREDSRT